MLFFTSKSLTGRLTYTWLYRPNQSCRQLCQYNLCIFYLICHFNLCVSVVVVVVGGGGGGETFLLHGSAV